MATGERESGNHADIGCRVLCERQRQGEDGVHVGDVVVVGEHRRPQAEGRTKTYHYWVAVTDRNHAVIDKTTFDLPVSFPSGQDRTFAPETIGKIVIPRKDTNVSGANFEVLIGFEVTPKMAIFNRDGKRFRPNAGQASASAATQP